MIAAWGEYRGDAPALYDGTTELSWRETADRVERIAVFVMRAGAEIVDEGIHQAAHVRGVQRLECVVCAFHHGLETRKDPAVD